MVSLIVLALILRIANDTSLINIILLLAQIMMTQSSQQLSTTTKDRISSLLVLFLWILFSRVLSLSYNSLLLRTYNIRTRSLTVETLEDIVSKPELLVIGSRSVNEIKLYKPNIHKALINRVIKYESQLNIDVTNARSLSKESLIRDIVNRKAVMIVPTIHAIMVPRLNLKANIMASDTKYNSIIRFSYVSKGVHHFHRIIKA